MPSRVDCWFVVQTNPNCETKAVAEIRRAGFRAYQPKMARTFRHHRTRKIEVQRRAALVGYVFMRFPVGEPNFMALRECQGVRGVLYCDGRPYVLARQHVAALMRAQRGMQFDTEEARAERRGRLTGERNAAMKERFRKGSRISSRVSGIIAMVTKVTNRGTIRAVVDMGERPALSVEFSDPGDLEVLAA